MGKYILENKFFIKFFFCIDDCEKKKGRIETTTKNK